MNKNDPLRDAAAERYESEEAARARLHELYLGDLAALLEREEGVRVLFHWLDRAGTFGPISLGGEATIRAAAVSDYGRERVCEIQQAAPQGFIKIMKAGLESMNHQQQGDNNAE